MRRSEAFSPGHVTGLFYIADEQEDPLYKGSLGAGFSVHKGVFTKVSFEETTDPGLAVFINGKERKKAVVSKSVVDLFFDKTGISLKGKLTIHHNIEIPEGSGFGSSGAGALSLSLALNSLYGKKLSAVEAAQIAHIAEVKCRTGLGTVMGEIVGGFKILIKCGAPGIGKTQPIFYSENLAAIFLVFGPYSTQNALKNESIRKRINTWGKVFHEKLKTDPTVQNFMKYSRNFAEQTGLIPEKIHRVLAELDAKKIPGSMLMFGEVVFSVVEKADVQIVLSVFENFKENAHTLVYGIEKQGGKVIA